MTELGRTVGMPIGLPAFEWMVRIGASLLMRIDPELVLYGRYAVQNLCKNQVSSFECQHWPMQARQGLLGQNHDAGSALAKEGPRQQAHKRKTVETCRRQRCGFFQKPAAEIAGHSQGQRRETKVMEANERQSHCRGQ